ncbi:LPS-assembly protein LptD [Methylacidimicrobium cyclopophantes]|uniref:LPS-assembly protein LptD n=1 Tax=Methylacidimicrobium cyclopophantes TaxID=1041766 RepID=A0A5E6MLI1_9BACT|nr:LPS assembly protein LptD [Methylacidimicrobium cyclopophantes]VVM06917.1 LPS-assembly protein LptD [Methylacidimicrobium cyclopophantes]
MRDDKRKAAADGPSVRSSRRRGSLRSASGLLLLLALVGSLSLSASALPGGDSGTPPGQQPVEITAQETHFVGGIATAEGNAIVRYGDTTLYADRVSFDNRTRNVFADGNVRVYTGEKIFRAAHMVFNIDTKAISANDWGLVDLPLLATGEKLTTPETDHYHIDHGMATVENREKPGLQVKARTMDIYAGDRVLMRDVVIYLSRIPVLWLPAVSQSLDGDSNTLYLIPGDRSYWGYYLLLVYNWKFNPNLSASFQLNYYQDRGIAAGSLFRFKPNEEGFGNLRLFGLPYDQGYLLNYSSLPRYDVGPNRFLASLQERYPMSQDLTLTTDLNYWTDPYIMEDFYYNSYMSNRQPNNVAWLNYYNTGFTMDLLVQDNLMPFFNGLNRLPELDFETNRAKIFHSPIAYESRWSVVNFEQQLSNLNPLTGNLFGLYYPWFPLNRFYQQHGLDSAYLVSNYGGWRWDTLQQLSYPKEYFHWLSLTPRLGVEGTYWSDQNVYGNAFNAPMPLMNQSNLNFDRGLLIAGLDASFKLSKTWSNVESDALGIHGLRHVIQPFATFQYIPNPYGNPYNILGFDSLMPTITPSLINPIDYPSIDSFFGMTYLRAGATQRLQTKRNGQNYDLAELTLFTDANWDRKYNTLLMPTTDTVNEIYGTFDFNPVPWFMFHTDLALPTYDQGFTNINNSLTWQFHRSDSLTLGYQYLDNVTIPSSFFPIPQIAGGFFPQNNILPVVAQISPTVQSMGYVSNFWRINENWQVSGTLMYMSQTNSVPVKMFSIYRDLGDWIVAFSFQDFSYPGAAAILNYYLTFTLKAFPSFKPAIGQ